ncbi:MAG: AMP-binding protein [Spirochaetaceae bacterium]|nr:AMP-binding protein [Spirochaetaceae bacterium]
MEKTIIRMLHEAVERYPERAYTTKKVEDKWVACSYSECNKITDKIAASLITRNFATDEKVSILAEGSTEWVNTEMGIIKSRGVSVPLSIKLTAEEIGFRVNHSESTIIVVSHNTFQKVESSIQFFDHKVKILYLNKFGDEIEKIAKKNNWVEWEDYLLYSSLISEGEKILETNPNIVSDKEKEINENDTINICYTSGTTGNPKGIMLTHLNYWANSHDAVKIFELPDNCFETLVVLPVDHSFAHTVGIYTSFLRGITLHFVDSGNNNASIIRNFPKNLKEVNPSFMMSVPSISGNFMKRINQGIAKTGGIGEKIFINGLKAGIARNGDGFNTGSSFTKFKTAVPYFIADKVVFPKLREVFGTSLNYFVGGGALLEAKQQRFFAAIGIPIYQGYGLTEAAPVISSNSPLRCKYGTSGMVAPSIKCKIMIDDTTEAKVMEKGEIVIQGDNVMKGYYKNPEATAEVLRDNWLWTGDLGYFDNDGFLVVTGREKALLINRDGEKYSPEEVEELMYNNIECINQLLIYNDHKFYTTSLVTLQDDIVAKMIVENNLKTPEEAHDFIIKQLRSYEEKATGVPNVWLPHKFAIIEKPFSEDDGLVNSTMKLVRYKTIEFYKDRIDKLYIDNETNSQLNIDIIKKKYF